MKHSIGINHKSKSTNLHPTKFEQVPVSVIFSIFLMRHFTYGFSSTDSAAKLGWFSFLYGHALWWNIELRIVPLCRNQFLNVGGLCFTDAGPEGDWGVQGCVWIHRLHAGGGVGAETGGGGGHPGRNPGNLIHGFGKERDLIVHKVLVTFGKVIRHLVHIPAKIRSKWKWHGEMI